MKTIKIILGVITIFVLAFFLTGLFVKETTYQIDVTINKPISQVFSIFNNPENIDKWIPEIREINVINDNLGKTGSTYRIVIDNKGQDIVMVQKVMAFVKNEKVTLFFDAQNMFKKDDYIFKEKDGVTTIQLSTSCRSDSYIMACVFPYFKSTFKAQDQGYLNNFKEYIEN